MKIISYVNSCFSFSRGSHFPLLRISHHPPAPTWKQVDFHSNMDLGEESIPYPYTDTYYIEKQLQYSLASLNYNIRKLINKINNVLLLITSAYWLLHTYMYVNVAFIKTYDIKSMFNTWHVYKSK